MSSLCGQVYVDKTVWRVCVENVCGWSVGRCVCAGSVWRGLCGGACVEGCVLKDHRGWVCVESYWGWGHGNRAYVNGAVIGPHLQRGAFSDGLTLQRAPCLQWLRVPGSHFCQDSEVQGAPSP